MSSDPTLEFGILLLLGAVHGVNPAMGWLFAVALGLQEGRRGAVWAALGPLALGHALAIAAVLVVALALGLVVPPGDLRWVVAAALLGMGVFHLLRHRHPRWGGMRVGPRDLAIWSFLMGSAHGAGLMALPFVLSAAEDPLAAAPAVHAAHAAPLAALPAGGGHAVHLAGALDPASGGALVGLAGTLLHTGGYLLVAGLVAFLVYDRLGVRILRSAWINLDALWAGSLILTALLTPFL